MGDISTWNPVDNSNTAAPPDGWPESMPPSAVNNSARAMMGAVRRWYDTVTAQLASLTTSVGTIANYLPLSGGSLTGTLSAPQYNINGVLFANGDGVTTHIYDGAGGTGLHLQAAINYYDADTHVFRNNTGSGNAAVVDASGNFAIGGNYLRFLASSGTVNTTGGPLIFADLNTHVYKLGAGDAGWNFQDYAGTNRAVLNSAGGLSLSTINATGNITAAGYQARAGTPGPSSSNNFNIEWRAGTQAHLWIDNVDQGALAATTGGTLTAPGNITAPSGTVSAVNLSASGDVTAAGSVTAGSVHCQGTMQVDGQSNLLGPLYVGPGGAWARIDSSGSYNVTGSWQIISDGRAKEDVTPYRRGLEAIMALTPVAYRYRPEVFGAQEAEKVRYGLVADEVAPVVPEMVGEAVFGGRHLSTLNMGHLNVVLVRACQDLAAQNAALAARITALEGIQ